MCFTRLVQALNNICTGGSQQQLILETLDLVSESLLKQRVQFDPAGPGSVFLIQTVSICAKPEDAGEFKHSLCFMHTFSNLAVIVARLAF